MQRTLTPVASSVISLIAVLLLVGGCARAAPQETARHDTGFIRTQDVIYGRKFGTALTMDVFTPTANANGAAVIWVVSGGWFSSHDAISATQPLSPINELVGRGYTVFAVVHGSQPEYTIPEVLQDMHRAVRFIRFHAGDYHINPARIGITGGSAGGHLSLMQGVAGNNGDAAVTDRIERVSSRVQAVACFFPPTDFLNYGKPGEHAIGSGVLSGFAAPFAFHELDPKRHVFVPITDEQRVLEISRQISPITHVSADAPPTLIIHGDNDALVPLQQSQTFVKKLKDAGVPAELVVKPGAGHGWADIAKDMPRLADWFDRYLRKQ